MSGSDFCYAQARLHSRHGTQRSDAEWHALESARSFSRYLEMTRSGSTARLTVRIGRSDDAHTVELRLREALRAYVGEVAEWAPKPWRAAVRWSALLPELPLLAYLLDGGEAWPWMAADPLLGPLAASPPAARLRPAKGALWEPILRAGPADTEGNVAKAWLVHWLAHWRELWPTCAEADRRHLEKLIAVVGDSLSQTDQRETGQTAVRRRDLSARLTALFRRASPGPAAVFCHLGLVALDAERLRGGLQRRLLLRDASAGVAA